MDSYDTFDPIDPCVRFSLVILYLRYGCEAVGGRLIILENLVGVYYLSRSISFENVINILILILILIHLCND